MSDDGVLTAPIPCGAPLVATAVTRQTDSGSRVDRRRLVAGPVAPVYADDVGAYGLVPSW